ncbi:Type VI secretion protein [Bordetella sputigena]|uniref:type VI secretion system baseplate subunit TssG n=1 Tax=Bordetella sputigena TaxID=1416810 RepID=UPI0039EFE6EA
MPHDLGAGGALALHVARFEFLQALRLIESAHPDRPRPGCSLRPRDDAVRLAQTPALKFVASELAGYLPAADGRPARLTVNVLGLFGTNSPMPLYFTEYAHNRMAHEGDTTISGFLDMFHHRQLSLFYRAWAASQPVLGLGRGDARTGYRRYVGSLCGLAVPASTRHGGMADIDQLQFCGLLATRTRHASGLGLLLSRYFGVQVAIRQFIGLWMPLDREDRARLRRRTPALGTGLVLGARIWDRQSKFRLVAGPIGKRDMRRLLPGTDSHRRLIEWVELYTGGLLHWDLELRVAPEAAACMRFDGNARLAYTSWLGAGGKPGKSPTLRIQPRRHFNDKR